MNHEEAARLSLVEKYLLEELPPIYVTSLKCIISIARSVQPISALLLCFWIRQRTS